MNHESLLLSKVIQEKSLAYVLTKNVNEHWFADKNEKKLFNYVCDHYKKYGETPSLETLKENYPTYVLLNAPDKLDFYIDSLLDQRRRAATVAIVQEAIKGIENQDHESAISTLQSGLVHIEESGLSKSSDLDITSNPLNRWDEYLHRKENPGLRGIPTGFSKIDQATGGIQNGQLIVLVAPPKTGKSTLALQIALNMHRVGQVPMFQSFEMSNTEQESRFDSMKSKVSHRRLLDGALSKEEESRYKTILKGMAEQHKFWLVDSAAGSTITGIAGKMQTLQPDVVFIDGVYLMIDEQSGEANTPQALTNITRSLKRLAQRMNKPIFITTQTLPWKAKKGQVTSDSIGYSSSFVQDADVVLGLQKEAEDLDITRILKILESRNCPRTEVSLDFDWNQGLFAEMVSDGLVGQKVDYEL
jgi:replicative DNA helicase